MYSVSSWVTFSSGDWSVASLLTRIQGQFRSEMKICQNIPEKDSVTLKLKESLGISLYLVEFKDLPKPKTNEKYLSLAGLQTKILSYCWHWARKGETVGLCVLDWLKRVRKFEDGSIELVRGKQSRECCECSQVHLQAPWHVFDGPYWIGALYLIWDVSHLFRKEEEESKKSRLWWE